MEKIYIAKSEGRYKIGVSVNPQRRMRQLKTGNPKIELFFESEELSNAYKLEHELHKKYSKFNIGGEWFSNIIAEEVENIRIYIEQNGNKPLESAKSKNKVIKINSNKYKDEEINMACERMVEKLTNTNIRLLEEEVKYLREENKTIEDFNNAFNGLDVENRISNAIYKVLFDKNIYELRDEFKPRYYESFKNYLSEIDLKRVVQLEQYAAIMLINYVPLEQIESNILKATCLSNKHIQK